MQPTNLVININTYGTFDDNITIHYTRDGISSECLRLTKPYTYMKGKMTVFNRKVKPPSSFRLFTSMCHEQRQIAALLYKHDQSIIIILRSIWMK